MSPDPALQGDIKGESMLWITVMVVHPNKPPFEYVQGFDVPVGMAKAAAVAWARETYNVPMHRIVRRAEVY